MEGTRLFAGTFGERSAILTYLRTVGSETLVFLDISAIEEPS